MRSYRKSRSTMYNYNNKGNAGDAVEYKDYGAEPFTINLKNAALQNTYFTRALWTGKCLQLTLMSINPKEDVGLEVHPHTDQFLYIVRGSAVTKMGDRKDNLDYQRNVYENHAVIIPAGKWHNLINTGNTPLKLFSIYAPPEHPRGTIHKTKADEALAGVAAPVVAPQESEDVHQPRRPDKEYL